MRQHAEDKIYSALGRLRRWKQAHPEKILGLLGCMAQKEQQQLFDRVPYLDLVVGPGQLHRIAELLELAAAGQRQQLAVSLDRTGRLAGGDPPQPRDVRSAARSDHASDAVSSLPADPDRLRQVLYVLRGPHDTRARSKVGRRGRSCPKRARWPNRAAWKSFCWARPSTATSTKPTASTTRLADLLIQLHDIPGIERLKFVTNFPKDMTPRLLETVRDLPKCSPYLHVPLQSGSNAILQRMKRGYTVEEYRDMMHRI